MPGIEGDVLVVLFVTIHINIKVDVLIKETKMKIINHKSTFKIIKSFVQTALTSDTKGEAFQSWGLWMASARDFC